jgi:hypothetical protein
VVDEVFEDQHRSGALEDVVEGGQRLALEGGQCAAVDVEAGDLLGQALRHHEARCVSGGQHVGQCFHPPRRHQEGARLEACLDRAPDHLLPLCEEETVLGLDVLAQLDVTQVAVVGEPGVRRVRDLDDTRHQRP